MNHPHEHPHPHPQVTYRIKSRTLIPSVSSALYWRSALPAKYSHGSSAHHASFPSYPSHVHFYNSLSTYIGRTSLRLGRKEYNVPEIIVTPTHRNASLSSSSSSSSSSSRSQRPISHQRSPIAAMDIDRIECRFLLVAGTYDCTIRIYDLSLLGSDQYLYSDSLPSEPHSIIRTNPHLIPQHSHCIFRPIATSKRAILSSFSSSSSSNHHHHHSVIHPTTLPCGHFHSPTVVQWYPMDSGAFLSADMTGNIYLWDTNTLTPVSVSNIIHSSSVLPFSDSPTSSFSSSTSSSSSSSCSIRSMTLPLRQECSHCLAAIGCYSSSSPSSSSFHLDDTVIRLYDIQSGSIVHHLYGHGKASVGHHSNMPLQWHPTHDYILVSGGDDATIRFWDIRKSGHYALLHLLDRTPTIHPSSPNRSLVFSHDEKKNRNKKKTTYQQYRFEPGFTHFDSFPSSIVSSSTTRMEAHASKSYVQSHGGPVSSLSFTPDGFYLLSASSTDQRLQLWDVRPGTPQGGCLLPTMFLAPSTHPSDDNEEDPLHIVSPHVIPAQEKYVPMQVTQPGSMRTATVWIGHGSSGDLLGYKIHGLGGMPDKVLSGHLDSIRCITLQENSMRIFSGGVDGMVLGWGARSS